jgi:ribosomal protein L14E/L6E/L27E
MEEKMVGLLAMSKAGHDKGALYVIIREEGEYVYVADGRIRTSDRPKKKNRKHVQIIKKKQITEPESGLDDIMIRKIIKEYQEERNVKG